MIEEQFTYGEQPHRPSGWSRYDVLNVAAKAALKPSPMPSALALSEQPQPAPQEAKPLFTMSITATTKEGATPMDEAQFLINLIFKPEVPRLRLRPEETQLLLAYFGEILKEVEVEEQRIIEEQTAPQE